MATASPMPFTRKFLRTIFLLGSVLGVVRSAHSIRSLSRRSRLLRAATAARSDLPPPFGPLAQASRSLRSLGLGGAAQRPHQRPESALSVPTTPQAQNPRPATNTRPHLEPARARSPSVTSMGILPV